MPHIPTVNPEGLSSQPFKVHRRESRILASDFSDDPALSGEATLTNPSVAVFRWDRDAEEWEDVSELFEDPDPEVAGDLVQFRLGPADPDDAPSGAATYAIGLEVETSEGDTLYGDHRLVLLGGAS
jgi:hypothetical protein